MVGFQQPKILLDNTQEDLGFFDLVFVGNRHGSSDQPNQERKPIHSFGSFFVWIPIASPRVAIFLKKIP